MPNFGSKGGLRWLGPMKTETSTLPTSVPVRTLKSQAAENGAKSEKDTPCSK